MNVLSFIFGFGCLISIDSFLFFVCYIGFQYFNRKYNSKLQISILEEENKFLKEENKKIGGTSSNFWDRKKDLS